MVYTLNNKSAKRTHYDQVYEDPIKPVWLREQKHLIFQQQSFLLRPKNQSLKL